MCVSVFVCEYVRESVRLCVFIYVSLCYCVCLCEYVRESVLVCACA